MMRGGPQSGFEEVANLIEGDLRGLVADAVPSAWAMAGKPGFGFADLALCAGIEQASTAKQALEDPSAYCLLEMGESVPAGLASLAVKGSMTEMRLAARPDCTAFDGSRLPGSLAAADLLLIASLLKGDMSDGCELLHYDQIAMYNLPWKAAMPADLWDAYGSSLRELRSTVWDWDAHTIALLPFYKFRNENECAETSAARLAGLVSAGAKVEATEKIDGSFVQMRWLEGRQKLLATTSGTMVGSAKGKRNMHVGLVESQLNANEGFCSAAMAHSNLTLMYELVDSASDPHTVGYPAERNGLWLIGARDVRTGRILGHAELAEIAEYHGLRVVPLVSADLSEIEAKCASQAADDGEGFVVNIGGLLVKCKTAWYLAASKLSAGAAEGKGFKGILELMSAGTLDDALSAMPDAAKRVAEDLVREAAAYDSGMSAALARIMDEAPSGGGRDFADWVESIPSLPAAWKGYLFALGRGREAVSYLLRNPFKAGSGYIRRSEFEQRSELLDEWIGKEGCADGTD